MIATLAPPPLEKTVTYLLSEGWELVSDNERWYVLEGCEDTEGEAFEVILSKNESSPDFRLYAQQTIDIVASLTDKAPEVIVAEINRYDRDILDTRIVDSADTCSVPLRYAIQAIAGLKRLFVSAADSELWDSKPHYAEACPSSDRILDEVRFGHTFSGSFGFSVESPVRARTDMFSPPIQRRVMERIVRGLASVEAAANRGDLQPLEDGYLKGFSANMCDAILSMTNDRDLELECGIRWSKKEAVSDDVSAFRCVTLRKEHFECLRKASEKLKSIQPELVTVEGHIVSLRSSDDPQSEDAIERKVTVSWHRDNGNSRNIVITLDRDQYLAAITAHRDNSLLSVKGYILGAERQLAEPREFRILA